MHSAFFSSNNVLTLFGLYLHYLGLRVELDYTSLQLVYQLFTTNVMPQEEEVGIVMQMAEEAVRARERDPYTVFANRVKELNYGNSYFFRVMISFFFFFQND